MNHLWSPWRMEYIQNNTKVEDCIFCTEPALPDGAENLVVMRSQRVYVILNRYPYTCGHLMVVPLAHQPTLEALDPDTRTELIELVTQSMVVLRKVYRPQGFNIGANIGETAGAGIVGHVHMHVVPRWAGDTNFMSTLGETRVLPESLEETYQRIKAGWET